MKILYVPLDERPCNAIYPQRTAEVNDEVSIFSLPITLMGQKKQAGNVEKIRTFVKENFSQCSYGIFSAEMLLYGGLLPSRLHYLTQEDLDEYRKFLIELHTTYPNKKIYLSNLIMRTPRYNSSDEEPDYYEEFGEAIFRHGWLKDKYLRGQMDESEKHEWEKIRKEVPHEVIADYENRREFNVKVNLMHISLIEEGIIDFLSIPQDDSAPYGYTTMDQKIVYGKIAEKRLKTKIMVYPGADEVGFTLLARAYNDWINKKPTLFVRYSSTLGPQLTPLYEDRPINESLKAHLLAAGFKLVDTEKEAEFILAYNTPGKLMQESWDQLKGKDVTYDSFRHLPTFVEQMGDAVDSGKKVGICDSAFANGGEIELIQMLDEANILEKLLNYKAWNTNCNSLGSSLAAFAFCQNSYNEEKVKENLLNHIYEDLFYQTVIRRTITDNLLENKGLNYFDLGEQADDISKIVTQQLGEQHQAVLKNSFPIENVIVDEIQFPWNRMFEIFCSVKLEES